MPKNVKSSCARPHSASVGELALGRSTKATLDLAHDEGGHSATKTTTHDLPQLRQMRVKRLSRALGLLAEVAVPFNTVCGHAPLER